MAQPAWRLDGLALAYVALTHGRFQLWAVARDHASGGGAGSFGQLRQLTNSSERDATSRPVRLIDADAARTCQWLQGAAPP